jgi:hypothetical protein
MYDRSVRLIFFLFFIWNFVENPQNETHSLIGANQLGNCYTTQPTFDYPHLCNQIKSFIESGASALWSNHITSSLKST